MAQTIKLKRSAVSGNTPSTSDLELGEIAINTYDGKVFIKKDDGSASVVEVGAADNTKLPLAGGTLTGNLSLGDSTQTIFGAGSDLTIFSNGTHGLIKAGNASADIRIESDSRIVLCDRGFNESFAIFNDDDDVKLFHDGSQKFATTSGGIQVTGDISNASGSLTLDSAGDISFDADGGDFRFKDNGTQQFIIDLDDSPGDVMLRTNALDKDLIFQGNDGGTNITALTLDMSEGGSATFANNVTISGNLEVTGTTTQTGSTITNSNFTGLSNANSANSTDFGFYGKYVESSTTKYAGMYYDASTDNTFKIFCDTQTAPTTTVNEGATGYALANLSIAGLTVGGNTSVSGNLDVVGQISSFNSASSSYGAMNLRALEFVFKNAGGTEKVRFNNQGIGVGTSSVDEMITIDGGSAFPAIKWEATTQTSRYLQMGMTDALNYYIEANGSLTNLAFKTAGTERMRLDSSGNLIVGKTATTFATQGAVINNNGTIDATRSGEAALFLNRLSSDGNIISLYKDSVAVGNIATVSGDLNIFAVADR